MKILTILISGLNLFFLYLILSDILKFKLYYVVKHTFSLLFVTTFIIKRVHPFSDFFFSLNQKKKKI